MYISGCKNLVLNLINISIYINLKFIFLLGFFIWIDCDVSYYILLIGFFY